MYQATSYADGVFSRAGRPCCGYGSKLSAYADGSLGDLNVKTAQALKAIMSTLPGPAAPAPLPMSTTTKVLLAAGAAVIVVGGVMLLRKK